MTSVVNRSLFLSPPRQQVGADEGLQIAVNHAIDVADLGLGAVILDHAVRLQDVGANLRAEFNIEFRVLNFLGGGALFLHFKFIELRAQHAHGAFFILVLRALILAIGYESGREVSDANRGIRGVHMLSALAAGAISIDADIFRLDDNFNAFVNFRRHVDAGKGSMAPLGLIEGRNADEAVHADLALQKSEGVLAVHGKRRGLQPSLFTGLVVVEYSLEALPLSPAQIHAQEHVGPILRLGAAGSGMDGDDGVAGVVLAGEQCLGFETVEQLAQRADFALQVGVDALAFFGEIEVGGNVFAAARQVGVVGEHVFQALLLAHHLLRALRIRPQIRVGRLLLNFG